MNTAGASVTPVTVTTYDTNIASRLDDMKELHRTHRRILQLRGMLGFAQAADSAIEDEIIKLAGKKKAIQERLLAFINQ